MSSNVAAIVALACPKSGLWLENSKRNSRRNVCKGAVFVGVFHRPHQSTARRAVKHNPPPPPPLIIAAMQTAGVAVVLKAREISFIGVVLLVMVLLLLVVLRTASRVADAKSKLVRQLAEKADAWYIDNGKVRGDFTWLTGHMHALGLAPTPLPYPLTFQICPGASKGKRHVFFPSCLQSSSSNGTAAAPTDGSQRALPATHDSSSPYWRHLGGLML